MNTKTLFAVKCVLGLTVMSAAAQTVIPVPNGDFSNVSNNGSIGGLIGSPIAAGPLGAGPWSASSSGINLIIVELATPTVEISGGELSFGGLAVVNIAGLASTHAEAFVSTGVAYQSDTTYSLSFDYDSSNLLTAELIEDIGFTVSLTSGTTSTNVGTLVASTLNNPSLLSITLGGNSGAGTLTFTTPSAGGPTGDVGIRIGFGDPNGLLGVSAINSFSMDNFALTATPVPEPSGVLLTGLAGLGLLARRRRAA